MIYLTSVNLLKNSDYVGLPYLVKINSYILLLLILPTCYLRCNTECISHFLFKHICKNTHMCACTEEKLCIYSWETTISGRTKASSESKSLHCLYSQWKWVLLKTFSVKTLSHFKHLLKGKNRRESCSNKAQTSKRQLALKHRCLNLWSQISSWNCFIVLSRGYFIWSI